MQYAKQFGKDRNPPTLETLTILPFVLIKCGTASAVSWYIERTFVLKTLKIDVNMLYQDLSIFLKLNTFLLLIKYT